MHAARAVIVPVIAFTLVLAGALPADATSLVTTTSSSTLSDTHVSHPAITIRSDSEICSPFSGVTNCATADGTCNKPYIITGWQIQPGAGRSAVRIENTSKCILVQHNAFTSMGSSQVPTMLVRNVTKLSLISNVVQSGAAPALHATDFSHGGILSNVFRAAAANGATFALVQLRGVSDATVDGNTLTVSAQPEALASLLRIENSGGLSVTNTLFEKGAGAGARIVSSDNVRILDSTFRDLGTAIDVLSSRSVTIATSTVRDTGTGISASKSHFLNVTNVEMTRTYSGIALTDSWGAVIDGVTMTQVNDGISASNSGTVRIFDTLLQDDYPCEPTCIDATGIQMSGTSLDLQRVTVASFDLGILFDSVAPHFITVDCSNIVDNVRGILVNNLGSGTVTKTNLDNSGLDLMNYGTSTMQARGLWWGTPDPVRNVDYAGKVQIEPAASAPIAC